MAIIYCCRRDQIHHKFDGPAGSALRPAKSGACQLPHRRGSRQIDTPWGAPAIVKYSVSIAAYEARRTVARAVCSALEQELPPCEVLVVDDGSGDDTAAVAEAAGARVIRLASNHGGAAARNVGLQATTAERVAFLDADDSWTPDHLRRLDAAFGAVPDAVVAFGGIVKVFESSRMEIPVPFAPHRPIDIYGALLRRNQVPMSASAVDRERCLAVGGFDESIRVAFDYDLWLRMAGLGPFVRAEGATLRYDVQSESLSSNYHRLLEESWQIRMRSWARLSPAVQRGHGEDLVKALELDLRRSWTRRNPDEIDVLLARTSGIPGAPELLPRWRRMRRLLPWLQLPLSAYDRLPARLRTSLAKLRGSYDYDLVRE